MIGPIRPQLAGRVERLARLYDAEVALRTAGRLAELDPSRTEEARDHFRRANGVRRIRIALLRRWQLL